jgi:hypothetical protein
MAMGADQMEGSLKRGRGYGRADLGEHRKTTVDLI